MGKSINTDILIQKDTVITRIIWQEDLPKDNYIAKKIVKVIHLHAEKKKKTTLKQIDEGHLT